MINGYDYSRQSSLKSGPLCIPFVHLNLVSRAWLWNFTTLCEAWKGELKSLKSKFAQRAKFRKAKKFSKQKCKEFTRWNAEEELQWSLANCRRWTAVKKSLRKRNSIRHLYYISLRIWRISGARASRAPSGVLLGPGWPQDQAQMDGPRKFRKFPEKFWKNRKFPENLEIFMWPIKWKLLASWFTRTQ